MIKWDKFTTWLIIGFLILLIAFFANEAQARDTRMEIAPLNLIAGEYTPAVAIGVVETVFDKYEVGVLLITQQDCDDARCIAFGAAGNMAVQAQRVVDWGHYNMGIGAAYWQNTSAAWSKNLTFSLSLGIDIDEHWGLKWRHYSTGGSSDRNAGLDQLWVGYTF